MLPTWFVDIPGGYFDHRAPIYRALNTVPDQIVLMFAYYSQEARASVFAKESTSPELGGWAENREC